MRRQEFLRATLASGANHVAPGHGGCCEEDDHVCTCQCHDPETGHMMHHVGPCCETASCGLNINHGFMSHHVAHCPTCQRESHK